MLSSPNFGAGDKHTVDNLERELAAKNQQIEALTRELRKRCAMPLPLYSSRLSALISDETTKSSSGILSTITATDKDGVVVQMEKMIRDLEISLRTKEQQNDDLKVQLAQKTEEVRPFSLLSRLSLTHCTRRAGLRTRSSSR